MPFLEFDWRGGRAAARGFVPFGALALAAALLLAPARFAGAAENGAADRQEGASTFSHMVYNLDVENDLFGSGLDRHYTNGMKVSVIGLYNKVPDWVDGFTWMRKPEDAAISFALGQNMYTPEDITVPALQVNERPWAGWLYLGLGLSTHRLVEKDAASESHSLESFELEVGVVGPLSYAEDTQTMWHELIQSPRPQGWNNQIKNEPGLNLIYQKKHIIRVDIDSSKWGLDFGPHFGASLGNIHTYLAGGGTIRFGRHLDSTETLPSIRPSLPGAGLFRPRDQVGFYLFGGTEARLVGRNIFLDGNSWRDSHSVDRNLVVGDISVGAVMTWRSLRIAATQTYRTRQYSTQGDPDLFGSISLGLAF